MRSSPDPSTRGSPWPVAALVVLALATPSVPRADNSNFRPYVVGSRAAGMGGAFTALADDGSGPLYNPAGIGFVRRSQLSLSGSVYGLVTGKMNDALGDGHNFNYSTIQTLPTATAGVFKLGPDRPDGGGVLAITVYVPDAVLIDDRDTLGLQQNAFLFASQSQTVWGGLTYAHRWGRLGFGAGGFVLLGTEIDQFDITAVNATDASRFATITSRVDQTTYGAVVGAGVRWDATDNVRLGLSVYSPEFGFGKRRAFVRFAAGDAVTAAGAAAQAAAINADDLHASPTMPLRAQAGFAWTAGRFTAAADVTLLAAREVRDDDDKAAQGFNRRIVRNTVVNGAAGIEYVLADRFPLRTGVFTDFAASNTPVAFDGTGTDPNASNTSHVDRFGGAISVGYRTNHTATDFGVVISGGSGTDLVPDNLDFSKLKPTTATQLSAYVFIGTSYEF